MAEKTSDTATSQGPLPMRRSRKAVYVIPSLLTTANIFCGFYSMMESFRAVKWLGAVEFFGAGGGSPSSMNPADAVQMASENFDRAAITIGFAALFDLLDGRVARMTNTTSEFGIELDSIADVVSFGLAPAVLAFAWGYGQVPDLRNVGWAASFLFLICGALRLARFNVQARQHNPNLPPKNPKVDKKAFVGLPIPFGAAMIASLAHFSPTPVAYITERHLSLAGQTITIGPQVFATALAVVVMLLAFLMVSTLRYTSFKNVGVGRRSPRFLILAIALVVLAIWFQSRWTLLIISTLYVSHGVVGKLWSLVKPRRSSAELDVDRSERSEVRH
ncbi:MAG TPA: CDP-diacylglycerol--serine O-phosphatidyltransferase [Blastocatellia bacterium]|nr:CDP-diacylglycerol--serine O-phosphatidyltransferase [Blastocatellia bacterium]